MSVSFVIPYRSEDVSRRRQILDWNLERLALLFPDAEVIVTSDDGGEVFNRSQARNNGAKIASGSVLAFVDADTVFNKHTVAAGVDAIGRGAPWVIPYGTYYRTDESSANAILNTSPGTVLMDHLYTYTHVFDYPPTRYEEAISGLILIPREKFLDMGGYNEGFSGWGYEDRAFVSAADLLVGRHMRCFEGSVFHLWHPEPHASTWRNPMIEQNRILYEKMRSITDVEEMRAINKGL